MIGGAHSFLKQNQGVIAFVLASFLLTPAASWAQDVGIMIPAPLKEDLGAPVPEPGSSAGAPDAGIAPDLWAVAEEPDVDAAAKPAKEAGDLGAAKPDAGKRTPAWTPKLSATVKPAVVTLGDPVTVTITVRHAKGVSVNLPLKLELGKFSELSRKDSSKDIAGKAGEPARVERTFVLQAAAYELGEVTLPAIEVTALGPRGELVSLTTAEVPIRIKSVMANEPNPKLKGLEPPVSVFVRTYWLIYLLIGLAAVGLVAGITLLVSRRLRARREAEKPPPPPIPPHVVALRRLRDVVPEKYIANERYKELFLLLSEIVREYVGGRWGFDALEMTTTEINDELRVRSVSQKVRGRLERYFNECDLVKFAKYRPEPDHARQAHGEAERVVRDTMGKGDAKPIENKEENVKVAAKPTVDNATNTETAPKVAARKDTDGGQPVTKATPVTADEPALNGQPEAPRPDDGERS